MKRGIVVGLFLLISLVSLLNADSSNGNNEDTAEDFLSTYFEQVNSLGITGYATSQGVKGIAICRTLNDVKGYYDIIINDLILASSDCAERATINCKELDDEEGWYDSDDVLVLAEDCPDYKEKQAMRIAVKEKNMLRFYNRTSSQCPYNCTCAGSTIKCMLPNGGREMTIRAGESGNVIVQIKGVNASTSVNLYKGDDGKVYGVFKGNKTRTVNMLPDQVRERIRERIQAQIDGEDITLNEDGSYEYAAKKRVRLFAIIPVRMMVSAEINAETGEVIKVSKPRWWGFLASDVPEQTVVGASCGTVTPGQNDACCINKGFEVWNAETGQCEFSS